MIKVIMNSGKEYEVQRYNKNDLLDLFYNELPMGGTVLKNGFVRIYGEKGIIINPSHVSSIEIIE